MNREYGLPVLRCLIIVVILLIAACTSSESEPLPTLAAIPTTPSPAVQLPTLAIMPPTATPTATATRIPDTPTPYYSVLGRFSGKLDLNETASGQFTDDINEHVYTFDGTTGQTILLTLERYAGDADPLLRLYNPQGVLIAVDDDSGSDTNARLQAIQLPATGLYSVQAVNTGGAGDYTLNLSQTENTFEPDDIAQTPTATFIPDNTPTIGPIAAGTRLQDHIPALGTLRRGSDFERFSFFAEAGDIVSIGVQPFGDSGLRPQFEVINPLGEIVRAVQSSTSQAGGAAFAPAIEIVETGAHLVIVTGENGSRGAYTVSYGSGVTHRNHFQGAALPDVRVSGTIEQRGVRDVWRAVFHAGDVVSVAVNAVDERFDPVIELVNANGDILYRDDNGGGEQTALIRVADIPETGWYSLRVYDVRSDNTGAYTLVWRYVEPAPTPTLPPSTSTILSIDDTVADRTTNSHVFQGQEGQRVLIEVIGQDFDPVATLLTDDDAVIAEGDDSDGSLNPRFIAELPADGTYTIRVSGYQQGGSYRLTVSVVL